MPARFISLDQAKEIADAFLETSFEGGRHLQRIKKIPSGT
jgi:ribose 5-phosphate isomerase B